MIVSRSLPFPSDLAFAATADFTATWVWQTSPNPPTVAGTPVDLTDYSATAIIYGNLDDASPLVTLTTTVSASGVIVLGGVLGTVQVQLTHAATQSLPSTPLRWTLRLVAPDGTQIVFLTGAVRRSPIGPLS
jgi:hypothetical protein